MSLGGGVSAQDHSSLPYEDARPLPTVRLALEGKDPHAAVNLLPVLPPVEDGVPVTVTNSDGEPVASVSVVVVDNKQVDRKIRMQIGAVSRARHGKDMEFSYLYILSLYGKKFRTDKQGRAKVTRARRGLFAVVDGRQVTFGNFSVREGTEPRPVSVVFSRPKGIDVLVVDSRGKPVAQVPVALVQHWSHGHRHKLVSGNTGLDGRVRLDRDQAFTGFYSSSGSMTYAVEAWVPVLSPPSVAVDPKKHENNPNQPLKLTLPPYGQVRVYVTDEADRPLRGVDRVELKVARPGADRVTYSTGKLEDDYATIPFVGVGTKVTVSCRYRGEPRPQTLTADGPRHPREMRVLMLKGVSAPIVAHLVVQDAEGKPVKNEELGVLFSAGRSFSGREGKTDSAGRLRVVVPSAYEDDEAGQLTIVRRGPGGQLVYKGAARIPLARLRQTPEQGDIKLQEEPLLVKGIVVDQAGEPVQGATVATTTRYMDAEYGSSSTSGRSVFFRHRVTTGKDGRFELRELGHERGEVKLSVSHSARSAYLISGGSADQGAEDHKVVIGRGQEIRGRVLGLRKDQSFRGSIRLLDAAGKAVRNLWASNTSGGKFSIRNCPPGTYALEFKLPLAREPFRLIEKIEVVAGKDCEDPRLQGIDFSKHGKVVQVEVVDESGAPVGGVSLNLKARFKNGSSSMTTGVGPNGKATVMVPLEGYEAAVSVSDGSYQWVKLGKLKQDQKVVMKPGFPVSLTIKNLPKLPADVGIQVRAKATKSPPVHTFQTSTLGVGGKLEFFVPALGDYELLVEPRLNRPARGVQVNQRLRPPEFRFEFSVKAAGKGKPKVLAFEFEEGDADLILEYVDEARRK